MKKTLFLIGFLIYIFFALAFTDKHYFIVPVGYKNDVIIRKDAGGDGLFAANRSGSRLHRGVDLLADKGSPVFAAKSGRVLSVSQNPGMGKYVIIEHSANIITIYGHLSEIFVRKNEYLRQGQVIGSVGRTGNASNNSILSHLHFEIRKNGIPQNPLEYI